MHAVVTVPGLVVLFEGLGALFRGRLFTSLLGGGFGAGLLAATGIASLLALNVQSYERLTHERPVATIETRRLGPQCFKATLIQPARGENAPSATNLHPLHGDEWRLEPRR